MKRTNPNTDPYSKWTKAKDKMKSDGFQEAITVLGPNRAVYNGQAYRPQELEIAEVHRFFSQDSYLSPNEGEFVPKVLLGLRSDDGEKFLLEYFFKSPYQEAVMDFVANVDQADEHQQMFQ